MLRSLALLLLAPALAAAGVLSVVFTNDVGGRIEPRDLLGTRSAGGAPALWEIVTEIREGLEPGHDMLLVDSGDFLLGGRRIADLELCLGIMNLLGYDAAGIGNHELDRGASGLRIRSLLSGFPLVGSNLRVRGRTAPPPGVRSSQLLDLPATGLRVGIVSILDPGLVPTHPGSINAAFVLDPVEEALGRELQRMEQSGARLIVLLSHQGRDRDLETARRFAGRIHLIVGGHYPSERVELRSQDTIVVQAQAEARELGRVRIPVVGDRPDPATAEVEWIPWAPREAAPNPTTDLLARRDTPNRILARDRKRSTLRETFDLALEAMLDAARSEGRSPSLAILNRGALRSGLPGGDLDSRDLLRVAPFDNDLVVLEVPAARLREALPEATAADGGPAWVARPATLDHLPGRGWVEVVVNDWLAEGRDGRSILRGARSRRRLAPSLVRVLEERILERTAGE